MACPRTWIRKLAPLEDTVTESEARQMPIQTFTSGRIRKADYDLSSGQLDLHWDNRQVLAYKQVPEEVFRRLCRAPNPAAYWEDRIADEYPKGQPRAGDKDDAGARGFEDLFGGGGADDH
jgi:hypothetical protein